MSLWRRPLDLDDMTTPRGRVVVLTERCKGCGFCIEYCPKDVLEFAKEFNRKGYHPPQVVGPELCVNCNLCEMICPDFAIFCVPVEGNGSPPQAKAAHAAVKYVREDKEEGREG